MVCCRRQGFFFPLAALALWGFCVGRESKVAKKAGKKAATKARMELDLAHSTDAKMFEGKRCDTDKECMRRCAVNVSCGSFDLPCAPRRDASGACAYRYARVARSPRPATTLLRASPLRVPLPRGEPYRSFSLLRLGDDEVWLTARTGRFPDAAPKEAMVLWRDAGGLDLKKVYDNARRRRRSRSDQPERVLLPGDLAHNYGFLKRKGRDDVVAMYGGRGETTGIARLEISSKNKKKKDLLRQLAEATMDDLAIVVRDRHPGCVEAVFRPGRCRYDGRLSITFAPKSRDLLLYARMNHGPNRRYVQVARRRGPEDAFGPFEPLRFASWSACDVVDRSIYSASVQENPVDRDSLVAIFPANYRGGNCSVNIAASWDGVRFSTPLVLFRSRCEPEGRVDANPVDGGFLRGANDDDDDDDAGKKKVYLYVHQSTPTRDAVLEPTYDPAIIRFAVDVDELQKYTQTARRQVAKSFFSVPGGGPAASDDDDDDFGERLKSENDELSELRRFCDEERTAQALVRRCVGDDRRTSVVAFRRGDSSLLFPRGEEEEEEEENDEVGGKEGGGFREKSPSIDVRRGACRQERTDQRVAVCVAGQRRTFLSDAVQRGFAEHVGGDESYHFFLALDIDVDPDHALTRLPGRAVRGVWSDGGDDDVSRRKDDCPAGTANHRFLLPMARRLAKCFLLISDAETRRPRYDYVLRLRPDHVVLRPLPAVEDWLRQAGDPDVLLYDDEVALGPRASASAILKGPSTTYADCPGLAEWRTACGDDLGLRLREDHSPSPPHKNKVPCCPMNLIRRFLPAVASSSSSASTSSSSTVNHHHHSTSRKQQQQQNRTLLRQCRSPRHPTCVLRPCDIDLLRENGKGAFSCVPQ